MSEILFWLSFTFFSHTWVGYPLILFFLQKINRKENIPPAKSYLPTVSVIIPVYNAADRVIDKINNTLKVDYPSEKLEIIIVSDGSTDYTVNKAKSVRASNVFVHELIENQGKSAAQNFGVKHANNEIIVFTDVDSDLDSAFVRNIVAYLADPGIGCVGSRALLRGQDGDIAKTHALYAKIEAFIREAESDLGMLLTLQGWGFAMRKSDFVPLDHDTGDDMVLPLEMALRNKRSVIALDAVVIDDWPATPRGELKARQRITLRNLTAIMRRNSLLNPWRFPRLSFAIWSHKLLRWMSPIFLLTILFCSLRLYLSGDHFTYKIFVFSQLTGYFVGFAGMFGSFRGYRVPLAGHVSSFLIFNYGFLLGLLKFARGRKIKSYKNIE